MHAILLLSALKEPARLSYAWPAKPPKLLKWSVVLDKVVCAVNKGQECIKRPNPLACNGYPGFVIAKVPSFKVKRLVPRPCLVSLCTATFRCICDCCSFYFFPLKPIFTSASSPVLNHE